MRRPTLARVVALVVGVALVPAVAGCGRAADEGARVRVAKVAVVAALSGEQSSAATGARNAVDLAVRQAQAAGSVEGWRLELVVADDAGDAEGAPERARELADDDELAAVVSVSDGPVLRGWQPPLDGADVVTVSAADTDPFTTRGADPGSALRPYDAYFRTSVPATAGVDTAVAALVQRFGRGATVALVHDDSVAGRTEATAVASAVAAAGLALSGPVEVGPPAGDADAALTAAVVAAVGNAAALYLAAEPAAAQRALAARPAGLAVVGGPVLAGGDLPARLGPALDGATAATVRLDPDPAAAAAFEAAYAQAGFAVGSSPLAASAYDAAQAALAALARCLPGAESVPEARKGCVAVMPGVSLPGATGRVAFDSFGDRVVTAVQWVAQGGQWVAAGEPEAPG